MATVEYAMTLEIVDVPWGISIGPLTQPGRCALNYEVEATAVDAEGAPLVGLGDCTFTAVEGQTTTVLPATGGCRHVGPEGNAWDAVKTAERLCVTALGKTGCRALR